MPDKTIEQQIEDLDNEMLVLTWKRRCIGMTAKDQSEWERLMVEIGVLSQKQKELLDKQIQF